jgi:hypothetical protein
VEALLVAPMELLAVLVVRMVAAVAVALATLVEPGERAQQA